MLFFIPGIIKAYAYSMSFYILADDNSIGANDAITKSRKMMDGRKLDLFVLQFSYFFEILLGIITFGIYFIWLVPKMSQATYNFYLELKKEFEPAAESASQDNIPPANVEN